MGEELGGWEGRGGSSKRRMQGLKEKKGKEKHSENEYVDRWKRRALMG